MHIFCKSAFIGLNVHSNIKINNSQPFSRDFFIFTELSALHKGRKKSIVVIKECFVASEKNNVLVCHVFTVRISSLTTISLDQHCPLQTSELYFSSDLAGLVVLCADSVELKRTT